MKLGVYFAFLLCFLHFSNQFDDDFLDPFDAHPRLLVKNGHLVLLTGRNKDLIFRSSGSGQIKINGNDLLAGKISQINQITSESNNDLITSNNGFDNRLAQIENRLNQKLDILYKQINDTVLGKKVFSSRAWRKLRTLQKKIDQIEKLLSKNECSSSPCQNGGTCEDGFDNYVCRCPSAFKGKNCEQDVDECSHYQSTELGCQNGGTCLNTFGGFHCLCSSNFHGVRCTVEFNDCRNVSDAEICGHGLCLNQPRTSNGIPSYRCVCYQGFAKRNPQSISAPCEQDIDECATGIHRCSRNPPVACINTPDGYTCGQCPAGYTGDGYLCYTADLCLQNNGGCSISPRVSCFTVNDRVICGRCPPGYVGDGVLCSQADGDICSTNNGGCSPNALCISNTAVSSNYFTCQCKPGYEGNGNGPQGCKATNSLTTCANNPCRNSGTCMTFGSGLACMCTSQFTGNFCEKPKNVCLPNPCRNKGVCVDLRGAYSCLCSKDFTGRNCEQTRFDCGGIIDSETGVLAFPISNGSSYNNNVSCVWIIKNSNQPGKILNITFTRFQMEKSFECVFDFLELFDGPSREYPRLGRYCGSQLPNRTGIIFTSFNSFYLHFQTDPTISHEGFALNWKTIEPTCGGLIINRTHGLIQSPGFPHHYPSKRDCYWQVIAEYGKRLQFIFTHLEIESSPNCTFDYIEIQETSQITARFRDISGIRFCNWTASTENPVPPPITTSGAFAKIHFHSDQGIQSRGFQMVFNQVPGVCGGILTGSSGVFQSPSTSYTSSVTGRTILVYENNIACDWLIRVLPDERISLKFLSFALESDTMSSRWQRNSTGVSCMFDYVEVYDGQDFSSPLRARLCGRITPPEIISSGRYLRIKFRSDMSVSLRGFVAQFQALCGGFYDELEGTIESPNYPLPILVSKNCSYRIMVPLDHVIELNITEMNIEFDHRCFFDYLKVGNQRYCGNLKPPPLYSMNNMMEILYVNDDTKPSRGFRAKFKAIEIGCGGIRKQGDSMTALSVERLREELPVSQCFWEIRANSSYLVKLKFFHSESQESSLASLKSASKNPLDCTDRFYIMVNDSDSSLIKKFCVDDLPPPLISTSNSIYVTYVFDAPITIPMIMNQINVSNSTSATSSPVQRTTQAYFFSKNFKPMPFYATYSFIQAKNFCDNNLFKNVGVIRSPRYPRRYPPNRNCTWMIHVDNGLQIRLNFTKFQLEPASEINGKCYDYLEIRNGRRPDSPLIGMFCGKDFLPNIVSHSNYLFLRFISDPSMQSRGFEIYYEATSTGCGGLMLSESGSIESPGFPNQYFSNMNCEWQIRVAQGSTVVVYIVDLNIEKNNFQNNCQFDYLEFFDGGDDEARSLGRYCNGQNSLSKTVLSSSNKLFLRFKTDESVSNGGFKLNYHTECNQTLVGRYGVIESPNYPYAHPHNLNCNWHILGPLGNNITIAFIQTILESSFDCSFDYINVSEVNRAKAYDLSMANRIVLNEPHNLTNKLTLCGNYSENLPPTIKTSKNEVVITFISDETRSLGSKFRLEWAAEGCGDDIRNLKFGTISSPNFPNPYPVDVECLWHIKAEPGYRVDLAIDVFDLEFSHDCAFDSLQVFSGPNVQSPLITKLCHQTSNVHLSSFGNWMTIKLISDATASRRGFNASFITTEKGCGGIYYVDQGIITSPNYGRGNTFEANLDCSYLLTSQDHFDVELNIVDLQLPKSLNCSFGYLAIYDGSNGDDETKLLAKLCGNLEPNTPSVFRANHSDLFVRFKSDDAHTGRGFNITFKKVCGKTIIVNDTENYKVITSTNYPHWQYIEQNCRFILKASKPSDSLTLRFTYLDGASYEPSSACQMSYVTVYEGSKETLQNRISQICSLKILPSIVSTGDTMLVVAHFSVFRALVSSLKSFCGGDFHSSEGYIANPGYPNSYPINIECVWVLEASPGNRYVLEFEDFDIESSDFCNNDYLEIRMDNSSGTLLGDGRLCGNKKTPSLDVTMAGSIWIKFRSDDAATVAKGFLLHFRIASSVMLSGESGLIGSPGYPNGFDFDNKTFLWYIVVPHNKYVKLEFIEFSLHGDPFYGSCSIQLSIFNGILDFSKFSENSNNEQLSSFKLSLLPQPKITSCGHFLPANFISDSNAITLMYLNTFYSYAPNKFLLKWSAVNMTELLATQNLGIPADVNSTFNIFIESGQEFNLLSTNYTDFGNNINWYFRTRSSMHLNISVHQLFFPSASSCWYNKMFLYLWLENKQKWNVFKNLCNGYNGMIEMKTRNDFRLHLQHQKSNENVKVTPKYNITIFPVCGGNFTDTNGQIDSQFDLGNRNSKICEWMIKVRPGRTIRFYVDYYSIGFHSNCIENQQIEIRNGYSAESPLLIKPLCGHNMTSFLTPETTSNYAYVIFKTIQANSHFKIRYTEVGINCGGDLTIHRPTEVLTLNSPNYPELPPHDVVCKWIIRGPIDYGLQLTLVQEKWADCNINNSYLEVFDGGSDLSTLISRVCIPSFNLNTITINNHITMIRYVLKKTDFKSRFNATITVDSCNREYYIQFLNSPEDLFVFPKFNLKKSFDFSQINVENLCTIKLKTQSIFYISLNITSIVLEGIDCSSGDVIEIRDAQDSFVMKKFCGPINSTNNGSIVYKEIISQSNELFITYKRTNFNSDNKLVGINFYASSKHKKCFKFINLRRYNHGVLFSPDYPKAVSRRIFCNWIFYNEPGTQIKLDFNWFDLGDLLPVNSSSSMRCDKMLIISPNIYASRYLSDRYGCSKRRPKTIQSLSNTLSMSLYASQLNQQEGFRLVYASVQDNSSCSSVWDSAHDWFVSNNFYNTNISGLVDCSWEMKLPANHSGTLLLDYYDVPGDCSNRTLNLGFILEETFTSSQSLCVPLNQKPQITKTKFVQPILNTFRDRASTAAIFFAFNRTKRNFFSGIRGEYFIQKCGGFFLEPRGEFTSTNYPQSYVPNTFCSWYFQNLDVDNESPGLKLTFTEFDIGRDCSEDYFLIQILENNFGTKKICNTGSLPQPIFITGSIALTFVSSPNLTLSSPLSSIPSKFQNPRKFRFLIEKVSHGCGGQLLSQEGFLQSPLYSANSKEISSNLENHQYQNNIECIWLIKPITDFHLIFEFNSRFDLEESLNCTKDFLLFEESKTSFENDNEKQIWSPLAKLCGHKTPGKIVSQSNLVRIIFRTNDKIVGDGFKVDYKQECGGLFQDESGIIYSPQYFSHGNYKNELRCIYKIQRSSNEYIRLEFEDFEVEHHGSCVYDSVSIYLGDHTNQSTTMYGPYCGSTLPPLIHSKKMITVVFRADNFVSKRGFRFRYNVTTCGGNLTASNGVIKSPYITDHYKDCVWYIDLPDEKRSVSLKIIELDLANDHCRHDCCNSLKITNHREVWTGDYLAYICDSNPEDVSFKSSDNHMTIYYQRGLWNSQKIAHFKIIYWSSLGPAVGCGGSFQNKMEGVIVSPDIDSDSYYEPNLDCVWSISVSMNEIITLEFERFDVEGNETENCAADYLQIYDGVSLHSQKLFTFCGRLLIPDKVVSSSNSLLLQFITNDQVSGHGFRAHFKVENRTCGGVVISESNSKVLTSPNYPNGYPDLQQCSWEIRFSLIYYNVPIVIRFNDLDLNCSRGDFVQFIEFRQNTYETFLFEPITLCSSPGPFEIVANSQNYIKLFFRSSPNQINQNIYENLNSTSLFAMKPIYRGFNVTYRISFCNQVFDGPDNGFVTNKNFPRETFVGTNIFCFTNITVPADRQINIFFENLSFYTCSYSNMSIYQGKNSNHLATYCDMKSAPNPIFSTSNTISILIQARWLRAPPEMFGPSDPTDNRNKIFYSMTYTSSPKDTPGCGGNLTSFQGIFTSPNYPHPYNKNQMCQWSIHTSGYHTITLQFKFFLLSPSCANNYLMIFDGTEDVPEKMLAKFCESDKPSSIQGLSNSMLVKLYTTMENYEPGFIASYKINTKGSFREKNLKKLKFFLKEPTIRGRVITKDTFKLYRDYRVIKKLPTI